VGLRRAGIRHLVAIDLWRDRCVHGVRCAGCRCCRCIWGRSRRGRLALRWSSWVTDGEPLIDAVGELVITQPMPSMPIFLWGDDDGSRLIDSYYSMYPGIWRHGDWIKITPRGTAIIYGRSDSTINRGGVRMGTAEIYAAVLDIDEVIDALIVDLPGRAPTVDAHVCRLAPGGPAG